MIRIRLLHSGEASNPGPVHPGVAIAAINPTSLARNIRIVAEAPWDVLCTSEHYVVEAQLRTTSAALSKLGRRACFAAAVPTASKAAAGVAIITSKSCHLMKLKCIEPGLQTFHDRGRALKAIIRPTNGPPLMVITLYGYTNSTHRQEARALTAQLLDAAILEAAHHQQHRVVIAGDFNCEPDILPAYADARRAGKFFDAQAVIGLAARPKQATCKAHGAAAATRRDIILLSRNLLEDSLASEVVQDFGLDVHDPVIIRLAGRPADPAIYCSAPPEVNLGSPSKDLEGRVSAARQAMDIGLRAAAPQLRRALAAWDTDTYWRIWSATVELALVQAAAVQPTTRRAHAGRGKVVFTQRRPEAPSPELPLEDDTCDLVSGRHTRRLKEMRRLLRIKSLLQAWCNPGRRSPALHTDIERALHRLLDAGYLFHDTGMHDKLLTCLTQPARAAMALGVEAAHLHRAVQQDEQELRSQRMMKHPQKLVACAAITGANNRAAETS